MFRTLSLAVLLLVVSTTIAQSAQADRVLRVGLFRERTVKQVMVMSTKGNCTVLADGKRVGVLGPNDGLRIETINGSITAKSLQLGFAAKSRIEVVPERGDGGFRLRDPERKHAERSYPGALQVDLTKGSLALLNKAPLEEYTAGVVSAEAGKEHHQEYYKLQSVSCRTYALTNQRKHVADGFDVCDGVHCQVFHGSNRNDSIAMAVRATQGLVLVDADIKMIHATFHSNCGGETVNAEDLWSKSERYLRGTVDTFCLSAPHATWEKRMPRSEWTGYLTRRYGFKDTDTAQLQALLDYSPQCRDLYLGNTWPLVPLKHVREDLGLRSTYFTVRSVGDVVVLTGRGFGHGVGLCQEGAMGMAKAGLSYTDILHHYYNEVHLVDLSTLDFFRDEEPLPSVRQAGGLPGR